ncbi:MAG: cysteine desulfurase [Gammaproteobacteria bacterium]|jgi:cysteine desulfurase/selenocysteine lyase|nr:cysteine desulfurase [Gammaproteobacteria bacterium]
MKTLSEADIARIRGEFPILSTKVKAHPLVYLDNANTSQKPQCVIAALDDYYKRYNANIYRGLYELSELATAAYEGARLRVAQFLNAKDECEIIFVKGTTEAINLVAQSYGRPLLKPGDEVLITALEHHSNIVPWQIVCQQTGATLRVAPINLQGEVIQDAYEKRLSAKTKIVAMAHISNALGTINPIAAMIAKAHAVGAITVIDGAQAAPHTAIDVQALNCDFYAFSSHKIYGPTGLGILYGKKALLDPMPPYQGGGEMIKSVTFEKTIYQDLPLKFEAGTQHIEGAIGLKVALDYLTQIGLEAIQQHEHELLAYATQLAHEYKLRIIGEAKEKASILSFTLDNIHAHDVGTILNHYGVAVRAGHHCAMPVMEFFQVPATLRASFSFYNTQAEIDILFNALGKVREIFK